MEKLKILLIVCLTLSITLFKCSSDSSEVEVDLSPYLTGNPEGITFSSIASSIEYIPLEVTENSIFGKAATGLRNNIQVVDDIIFISDTDGLISFDNSGRLITRFGSQGRGPLEYLKVLAFSVCKEKKEVLLLSAGTYKVFSYQYDGTFIRETSINNLMPSGFVCYNEKLVCHLPLGSRGPDNSNSALTGLTLEGKTYKIIAQHKDNIRELARQVNAPVASFTWSIIDDNLHICQSDYALITVISPDFRVIKRTPIILERGRNHSKAYVKEMSRIPYGRTGPKGPILDYTIETKDFLFIQLLHNSLIERFVYDKKTLKGYQYVLKSLVNDFDGGPVFWPSGVTSDGRLFMLISGGQILKALDHSGKHGGEITPFVPDESLAKLIDDPDFMGVPIMVYVTLKETI